MDVKYTLELDISDETIRTLTAARLSLDDLVQTKIEQALFSLTKGGTLVYRAEVGRSKTELFKLCPACDHSWAAHFEYVDLEGKKLLEPRPGKCPECSCIAENVMGRE